MGVGLRIYDKFKGLKFGGYSDYQQRSRLVKVDRMLTDTSTESVVSILDISVGLRRDLLLNI